MDLAEIRKKARQQGLDQADSAPGDPASPVFDAASDLPVPLASAEKSRGLQQFFPGYEFATEEEYIQGLAVREQISETDTLRWLTFKLGKEEYALSLEVIRELIKPRALTELPKVPADVLGILSLRGEVVPIIDLRRRLKLEESGAEGYQRIIICEGEGQAIGLLVDRIIQVARIAKADIEVAPLVLNDREREFVEGIGRFQERMIILLNPDEILKI